MSRGWLNMSLKHADNVVLADMDTRDVERYGMDINASRRRISIDPESDTGQGHGWQPRHQRGWYEGDILRIEVVMERVRHGGG